MSFIAMLLRILCWLTPLVALLLFVRVVSVWRTIQQRRTRSHRPKRSSSNSLKTLVVLGSGGHTTEMLQLVQNLHPQVYSPLVYMIATTDDTSERRLAASASEQRSSRRRRRPDAIYRIPRSREVGQSYATSVVTTLWSFAAALWWVGCIRPDVLLCNGPGTCLPVAIATLLYRVVGLCEGNLVFVESFCRVQSLSLTGRLLYPLADLFVVHWPELHEKYPKSEIVSTFVPNKVKSS